MTTQYSHGYGMRPPQGWIPPYQGGAPPIPPGVNVNPQQWQMGVWAFNPAYNMQRPPAQHVPWIPGQAWRPQRQHSQGQQQPQQQANFNPYKKVIKPPSAEYLAEPLRDNPLGLTGMIPAEDPYGEAGLVATTPWIWNPANLEADDSEPPNGNNRTSGGHHTDPSRGRQSSEPAMSSTRPDERESRANRHPTDPTSNGRSVMGSSSTSQSSSNSRTSLEGVPPFDRPKNPDYYRRLGYADGHQPLASNMRADSVPPAPVSAPPEPESFTSRQELKPTFSTNIVRTPNQYWSQSSRSSSVAGSRENSHGSMDSLSSRVERMSVSSAPHAAPLSRHSSTSSFTSSTSDSSSSISGVSSFVDEPASILSPLMGATPKPSARPIERHHTYPDIGRDPVLGTIAESPPRNHTTPTPHHRQQRYTPPESYEPYSSSPTHRASRSREHTPPRTPAKQTPPRDGPRHVTPSPANGSNSTLYLPPNPLIANPLPPPPREVRYLPISPPPRVGPPPMNRKRVRKGFWNRRGDHLTTSGYIVYAPPEMADPEELKDYPEAGDAYKDNFGTIVEHNPNRPELPESLPRYGKPPEQPYSSFLQYDFAP